MRRQRRRTTTTSARLARRTMMTTKPMTMTRRKKRRRRRSRLLLLLLKWARRPLIHLLLRPRGSGRGGRSCRPRGLRRERQANTHTHARTHDTNSVGSRRWRTGAVPAARSSSRRARTACLKRVRILEDAAAEDELLLIFSRRRRQLGADQALQPEDRERRGVAIDGHGDRGRVLQGQAQRAW